MPLNVDDERLNSDWARVVSWDLYLGDKLITTYADLRERLGSDGEIKKFLRLPAAMAMPTQLQDELRGRGFELLDYANESVTADAFDTVDTSGGAPMTTTVEPDVTQLGPTGEPTVDLVKDETEDLGGKPNPGTPADKRLKNNKQKSKSTPNSASEDDPTQGDGTVAPADLPVMQETPTWRGVLVVEGQATGDGREFAPDSLTWAVPPLPLRWQKVDSHGGMPTNETVRVGTIQRVWRDGGNIMGEGVFDLSGPDTDDAHAAYRANSSGALTGISIDADDITDADIEYVFPKSDDEEEEDDIFFLLFAAPEKIIFHAARIRAATLCDIPAFVEARITEIPMDQRAAAAAEEHDDPPPPFAGKEAIDSLVAHAWHDDYRPPKAWFEDPKLGQYTPIMVSDQGRVYGHAAQWVQCHLGFKEECVSPPFEDFHAYYMTGVVICDDGTRVAVGQITAGIEHAPLFMNASRAKEHYENTDAVVADVAVGNDSHGIWVAGSIRPDAHASRVHALRASGQVSPDWRTIGGALRMVALLTVNTSGYQTPATARTRSLVAGGQLVSLVSSGFVSATYAQPQQLTTDELEKLALKTLREKLRKRVHAEEV